MDTQQQQQHHDPSRSDLSDDIQRLSNKLDMLIDRVAAMMPRAEVETRYVSREGYDGALLGIRERLIRLEGGSQKLLSYIAVATGCLGTLISALGISATVVGGLILFILTHYKP